MPTPTDLRALLGGRYDAVIEKATLALYASSGCSDWPEVVDPERAYWLGDAAAALAAVLPDLLAEALNQGRAEGWDEGHAVGVLDRPFIGHMPNPYRQTRAEETR